MYSKQETILLQHRMTFPLPAATSSEKAAVVVAAEQEPPTKEPITSSPPKIVAVSPTLPEEELHIERDLASAMVQSRDSDGSLSPKKTKQIEETATPISSSPPQESIQERVQERIAVPPPVPSPPLAKADATPTVEEHHEESIQDIKPKPQESSFQKPPSSPLLSNQAENQNTSQPLPENLPLMSQYCGGCGDLLTIAPYGIDKTNNTEYRKVLASTYLNNYHIDQAPILQAAQQVQQNLIPTRTTKSKNTKAARKQRKLVAAANTTRELTKGLSKWPEEELRMDMTMIESLLQLKHAPLAAVSCKCWHPDHDPLQMSPGSSSPGSKPSSPRSAKKLKLYNSKQQAIKAKSGASLAKKKMKAVGGLPQEIVSTKTIITKCPKTGKKIKKTVRVVKKLVKKKLSPSQLPAPGLSPKALAGLTKQQLGGAIGGSASIKNLSPASKKKALLLQSGAAGIASGASSDLSKKRGREEAGSDDHLQYFEHPKRRRNDEKANPELRDKLMNCPLENGPLYPSQQELMELTTIRKRNALQTFYKRFNELRQFIVIFGDANVPQQFPENHSLGIWVNKMRMERKKWDTGSERTSLTERKIELLESIDFIWAQNHKGEIGWERRFQEIRKFKRKHGHCNVPTKSAENRALGRWVSTQRTMYKNYMKGFVGKSLTREEQERRIFLLLKEGFLFSMIPNGQSPPNTAPDSTAVSGEGGAAAIAASNAAVVSANMKAFLEAKDAAKGKAGVAPATSAAATSVATASPKSEASSSSPSPTTTPFESPAKTKTNDSNPKNGTNATDLPVVSVHSTKSTIAYAAKTESSSTSSSSSSNNPKEDAAAKNNPAPNKIISNDNGKSETVKEEAPPSSNGEVVATPVKDDGDASTPLKKPRASSIALVSVSTTPTTTPSVSTTASPDRSPEKTTDNSSSDRVIVSQLQSDSKSKQLLSTTEMPIVPSLKPQSTLDAISSQPETSLTTKQSNDDASKSNEIVIAAPAVGGNAKDLSHAKKDPQVPGSNTESESSMGLAASPTITANDTAFTTSTPPKSSTTLQQSCEANHAPYEYAPSQQLVTSNGLKIIVKLTDPSSDNSLSNHNPSPSRRSVRARKPSARQLEAEKTPPILGR